MRLYVVETMVYAPPLPAQHTIRSSSPRLFALEKRGGFLII